MSPAEIVGIATAVIALLGVIAQWWRTRGENNRDEAASQESVSVAAKNLADATESIRSLYTDAFVKMKDDLDKQDKKITLLSSEVEELRPLKEQFGQLQEAFEYLCDAVKDGYPKAVQIAREKAGLKK